MFTALRRHISLPERLCHRQRRREEERKSEEEDDRKKGEEMREAAMQSVASKFSVLLLGL